MKLRINLNEAKAVDPKKAAADKKKVEDKKAADKKAADKKKADDKKKAEDKKKVEAKKKQLKEALRPIIAELIKESVGSGLSSAAIGPGGVVMDDEDWHQNAKTEVTLDEVSGAMDLLQQSAPIWGTVLGVGGSLLISWLRDVAKTKAAIKKQAEAKNLSPEETKKLEAQALDQMQAKLGSQIRSSKGQA